MGMDLAVLGAKGWVCGALVGTRRMQKDGFLPAARTFPMIWSARRVLIALAMALRNCAQARQMRFTGGPDALDRRLGGAGLEVVAEVCYSPQAAPMRPQSVHKAC